MRGNRFWCGSLLNSLKAVLDRYRLSRYDDFTIAEHLRSLGARIGENCRIQVRTLGSEPWLVSIGRHCTIGTHVIFNTHDGGVWVFADEQASLQRFGTIDIRDNCFIGIGAILLPNIRIGPNSIVGAGSVVTRDVPPGTVAAGVPARPISDLERYRLRVLADWRRQRPPGYLEDLKEGVAYPASHIQRRKIASSTVLREHLERILWEGRRD